MSREEAEWYRKVVECRPANTVAAVLLLTWALAVALSISANLKTLEPDGSLVWGLLVEMTNQRGGLWIPSLALSIAVVLFVSRYDRTGKVLRANVIGAFLAVLSLLVAFLSHSRGHVYVPLK